MPSFAHKVSTGFEPTLVSFPPANYGAFGDLEVMHLTPLVQWSFATGLREQITTTSTASGGTVDANSGRLRLQTGTNAAGAAYAVSTKPASYRPGQGMIFRGTPFFTAGKADSRQLFGMGNAVDGYFFGYIGAVFGVLRRYNSSNAAFVAQADWNVDPCDGTGPSGFTYDPTKGIPMMIKYPYLGHGNIFFYIQNPATSAWILAHVIQYAGTSALPQLTNPCLNLYAEAVNADNTSNLILYVTCAAAFMDGERDFLGPQFGVEVSKGSVTTEALLGNFRNATNINGVANRGLIRLRQVSGVSNIGNGIATFRFKRGTTISGSPSYTPVSGSTADNGVSLTSAQSTMSYDTAGGISGGTTLFNFSVNCGTNFTLDMTPYGIFIAPGEIMTVTGASTASTLLALAMNWNEDIQ